MKPTSLRSRGHEVIEPALDNENFEMALATAQAAFNASHPDVVVGSSRGGAVAMNLRSDHARLGLLCPAWKKWGSAKTVKPGTTILHSRGDDVIPFEDSAGFISMSGLAEISLIEVGTDHRLADPESLRALARAVEGAMKRVVVISGAGISAESGLKTFPCADGHLRESEARERGTRKRPSPFPTFEDADVCLLGLVGSLGRQRAPGGPSARRRSPSPSVRQERSAGDHRWLRSARWQRSS